MLDLNQFAKEVHQNAVEHGWWEGERPFAEVIALIHSEISEALEEYRAGRPMVWHACNDQAQEERPTICERCDQCCVKTMYPVAKCTEYNPKPEGIAVELIDMCIRILDWFGESGETFKKKAEDFEDDYKLPELAANLHYYVSQAFGCFGKYERAFWLEHAFLSAYIWIKSQGIDVEALMLEKHEYNKTRPYKHGGRVC